MSPVFVQAPSCLLPDLGLQTREVTWLGTSLPDAQAREARAAGLTVASGPSSSDVVSTTPGTVATAEALRRFVSATADLDGDVRGVLRAPYDRWQRERAFGRPGFLVRLRGGGSVEDARVAAAREVVVPVEGRTFDVPLLDQVGGRVVSVDGSVAAVVRLGSWAGLLWANLLGLAPALIRELPGSRLQAPFRVGMAALRTGSLQPDRIGEGLVRRGRRVRVHPAATVEGSWLGDGVVIDAGAVVRHTILGAGARVEAQGLCIGSVLGEGAIVQRRGFVSFGVLDREAVCGGTLQLGYLRPRAQLKVGALLLDQVLGGAVRVRVGDRLEEAPLGVLGAALGPRAMVGARVTVAAGRVVPPDCAVVAGDGSLLLRPDVVSAGRHRVVDGALQPC